MFLFFRSICFVACAGILQWNSFFHVFVSFGCFFCCCLTTTIFLVLKYFSSDCGSSFGSRSYFDDLCDGWLSPSRQSIWIQRARVGTTENSFAQNKAVSTCMTRQHSAHNTNIPDLIIFCASRFVSAELIYQCTHATIHEFNWIKCVRSTNSRISISNVVYNQHPFKLDRLKMPKRSWAQIASILIAGCECIVCVCITMSTSSFNLFNFQFDSSNHPNSIGLIEMQRTTL